MSDALSSQLPIGFDRASPRKSKPQLTTEPKLQLTGHDELKLIIFDFDGTLADTFSWCLDIFDEVADKFRFKRLDRNNLDALRSLDARQLISQHRIPFWKLPFIGRAMRTLMAKDSASINLFPGIESALHALADKGTILAIVSSNSQSNVLHILGAENAKRFAYVECGVSLFGKRSRLRRILAHSRIPPAAAILIGDEIRDAQAARDTGIPFGAVAWGYTHLDALVSHGAQQAYENVEDMLQKLMP